MEEGLPSNPELKCSTMFGILYHGVSAGSGKLEAADGSENRYAGQEGSCRCQAKKSEREAEGIGMYLFQLLKYLVKNLLWIFFYCLIQKRKG